jgi:hypothetical protein
MHSRQRSLEGSGLKQVPADYLSAFSDLRGQMFRMTSEASNPATSGFEPFQQAAAYVTGRTRQQNQRFHPLASEKTSIARILAAM